jgi:D-lactate dehydrogenase (quinone)
MTNDAFIDQLRAIVAAKHVLTGDAPTRRFRTGYRFGGGAALAVVQPGSLVEQWRVLQACVAANKIVIMQAQNTGLTGGSTPAGAGYDRDIVIINTLRLDKIRLIRGGKQVICHPGATLDQLEKLLKPLGREPHSVIGSSCIGASVTGGIANNSGGALVRRGPAYTQLALYARLNDDGRLELVNHLGIALPGAPEEVLRQMDDGTYTEADIADGNRAASDHEYADYVRDIDASTPARYNADPRRLFETSGCAGKLAVFALRLDTFAAEPAKVFYIGTNDPGVLEDVRRHILGKFKSMPVSGEYLHRDAYDVAEKYGKDTFLVIWHLGTRFLPPLFSMKSRFDAAMERLRLLPAHPSDRLLQFLSRLFPSPLPRRMKDFRARFAHHLILEVTEGGIEEARVFLTDFFKPDKGDWFECAEDEGKKAKLHRFAVAGAGVRYRRVHADEIEDILAFDVALRRNDRDWFETLPPEISKDIAISAYCGHFLCHVLHQDYLVKKGADAGALKKKMLEALAARGAKYPAEHNVGHFYTAEPALKDFYRGLDPCNAFNPGVGLTSKKIRWQE